MALTSNLYGGFTVKVKYCALFALVLFCMAVVPFAAADDVQTLPEFNGPVLVTDPGPFGSYVVGTFNILPGDGSITISGTFGNSVVGSSAGTDVYLGSVLVGQCVEFAACYNHTVSWSDTLTAAQIASLGTGPVNLVATQTSQYVIRMGETTLDQATATPEPSSIFLFGTSLLGAGGILRRKLIR